MNNNERVARLKQLLEMFCDERLEHFRKFSTAKNDTQREYSRGCYETMLSVLKRIYNTLELEEVC